MTELLPGLCEDASKKEKRSLLFLLVFLRMDALIGDVCRCDHSNQNVMVSNNI